MPADRNRTVYSTETDISQKKSLAPASGQTESKLDLSVSQRRVLVRLDKKGRGGKSVTVIEGLRMSSKDLEALLKTLKTRLGTGGAVKDAVLEIQGDHRDQIITALESLGYRPKRSGG
jgi:translation initiation factor 1